MAIAGLVVQVALAGATAALAAWTGNRSLVAAVWHMVGGLPIWIFLAVYYGQREVERRETLVGEQVAGDATSTALFGELPDELQRVRRRLEILVGRGLPAVGVLVGGYLLGSGGLLLWRQLGLTAVEGASAAAPAHPVGTLFAAAAITFLAFLAGRWMSGCAREPAWRLLRGGASYLMSCFLVAGLVLVAAAVAAVVRSDRVFDVVALAVPAVMAVIGMEILLATLLEIYRPRRPGDLPRPAFDSRLLGLLTAPESLGDMVGELIRYQFGVDVSGSWFFRLLGRAVLPLTLLATAVLAALSCLVVVGPDEEGVVLRWGAVHGPARPAGIHLKLPWPIDTAATYPSRRVMQLTVSSDLAGRGRGDEAILWAVGDDRLAHIGKEYYPTLLAAAGGGLAVVDLDVVVHYRIRDLLDSLATAPDPQALVAVIAEQEVGRYVAGHDLGFLLSQGRVAAGPELAARIQQRADGLGLGVAIVDASITSLQPPGGAVARAFHREIAAGEQREILVEKARRGAVATLTGVAGSVALAERIDAAILAVEAARARAAAATGDDGVARAELAPLEAQVDALLATARGQAAERIHAARGERWTRSIGEQAARTRFAGELLAHDRAPQVYRAGRFFDVLAQGLADRRKFVVAGEGDGLPILRMDFADPASAIETLLGD